MKTPNRAVLAPAPLAAAPAGELTISFPDNRHASALFGQYDQNLARIERSLGVVCHAIGNQVTIKGPPDACERTRHVLQLLYDRIKLGQPIAMGDIDGAVQEGLLQGVLFPAVEDGAPGKPNFEQIATRKRGPVRARNAAQNVYLRALKKHELVFAEGPAGTGKTWLAVGYAVSLLEQGVVERLILSRPAVEAASGSASCPATCATRSIPTCGRSSMR